MAPKNRPYEQFGPYVLFKRLETDALGELWRAARIEGGQLGPLVALRRLSGGDRAAIAAAASTAHEIVPLLTGTSFARHQIIDVGDGIPYIAHEYADGRSLRHIVDRSRGGAGVTPNPIPIDQAIAIAEKVALSLETLSNMRFGGAPLTSGALIPQFVWVTDDGEIRVAGQMLGDGLIASLKHAKVAAEIGRYFAPEHQATGEPQKSSAVYGAGAILYLLVTGTEPPDPMTSSAWTQSVRAARTVNGETIPTDIRAILDQSLNLDPGSRYASVAEMKLALSALAHSGNYSATTFNLAFYLSNLLKKEMEDEAVDREKESKLNVTAYLEPAVPAMTSPRLIDAPDFGAGQAPSKSRAPLLIATAIVLALIGAGALYMSSRSKPAPSAAVVNGAPSTPRSKPPIVSEPIVASADSSTASPVTKTSAATPDPAAQKKAFEAAVNQKLQSEMMKLQDDYTRSLQKQQSKNAPVLASSPPATASAAATTLRPTAAAEDRAPSAAELDQARRETARTDPPALTASPLSTPATTTVPASAPVAAAVREGDVVLITDLDSPPHVVRPARPVYPPMAARQHAEANVLLTVLVSENGDVLDARVLRGDKRFGFEDAAVRAARSTKFSPPAKDGKRVRTWFPIPYIFNSKSP